MPFLFTSVGINPADLKAVSVLEKLPPYAGYIDAEVPGGTAALQKQASDYYRKLQADAQESARQHGVALTTELVEGDEDMGLWNAFGAQLAIFWYEGYITIPC